MLKWRNGEKKRPQNDHILPVFPESWGEDDEDGEYLKTSHQHEE